MKQPTAEILTLMQAAAYLRANGLSWEAVATALGRSDRSVRAWETNYPAAWERLFHRAELKFSAEVAAEATLILRKLLRSQNEKTAAAAVALAHKIRIDLRGQRAQRAHRPALPADPRVAAFIIEIQGKTDEQLQAHILAEAAKIRAAVPGAPAGTPAAAGPPQPQ